MNGNMKDSMTVFFSILLTNSTKDTKDTKTKTILYKDLRGLLCVLYVAYWLKTQDARQGPGISPGRPSESRSPMAGYPRLSFGS